MPIETPEKSPIDKSHINHIVDGFLDHSLPADEWTHEAHLVTGLALILNNGLEEAELTMPDMIRTYNEAKGGINSDTDGYHHTITIFYLRVLEKFRRENPDLAQLELTQDMLKSPVAAKMYPLHFYSKGLLFSVPARLGWVEPDIKRF